MKKKVSAKTISLADGGEAAELFRNIATVFADARGVNESKVIVDLVIERVFPEDLIFRDELMYCLTHPTNETFASTIAAFFSKLYMFSETIQNNARKLLSESIGFVAFGYDLSFTFGDDSRVSYFIDLVENSAVKFDSLKERNLVSDPSNAAHSLRFLINEFSEDHRSYTVKEILCVYHAFWKHTLLDSYAINAIRVGLDLVGLPMNARNFMKIYDIFCELSKCEGR